MAKFNIEVELDWMQEEEGGYSIDDELREAVVNGVKDELQKKALDDVVEKLDKAIAEKLEKATEIIEQRVDDFIAAVTEKQIEKIMIPIKKGSWSSEVEYIPISEYVGQRYEKHITEKRYDSDFKLTSYSRDAIYSALEKDIQIYLKKNISDRISKMVSTAQKEAENSVINNLEQTLKDQLAVDTIKRLNIPAMLENLQKKALEYEGGKDEANT